MSAILNDPEVQRVLENSRNIPCVSSNSSSANYRSNHSRNGDEHYGLTGGNQTSFALSEQTDEQSFGVIGGYEGGHSSDLVSRQTIEEYTNVTEPNTMLSSSFESASGSSGFVGDATSLAVGSGNVEGGFSQFSNYRIQQDTNPLVVRKQLNIGAAVYRQNIKIRFLRPPQLPPPGPLIIREIRPPQHPPAPPLVIRQRPPAPPTPPPLILRERPPRPPASIASRVVIKRLPPIPPPPRQVIIERYPPLPPKPRDIVIERWIPYGPMPKRRVIYQRAAAVQHYRTAKNMIICYEALRPRVERVFRRLGITFMNPVEYSQRYGLSLLDAQTLVMQARSHGVVEDIAPPSLAGYAMGANALSAGGTESLTAFEEYNQFTNSSNAAIDGSTTTSLATGGHAIDSYGMNTATSEYAAAAEASTGFSSGGGGVAFASETMESSMNTGELYAAEESSGTVDFALDTNNQQQQQQSSSYEYNASSSEVV